MRKPERKTIEGIDYEVAPLPASKGIDVLEDLMQIAGPLIASAPSLAAVATVDSLAGIIEHLKKGEIVRLAMIFAASTTVTTGAETGVPTKLNAIFDLHFAGDYLVLTDYLRFALEVNYGRFFAGLQARAAAKAAADAARAASPAPAKGA